MHTSDRLKKAAPQRKSEILTDSYQQVRNKVNSMNIQLKKPYFTNKISACKGNIRDSQKAINELLNKIRISRPSNIDNLKVSGIETVLKKDISETIKNFFCTIGNEIADKIDPFPISLATGDYEINTTTFNFSL